VILGLLGIGEIRFIRNIRGTRDSRACRDVRGISNIRDVSMSEFTVTVRMTESDYQPDCQSQAIRLRLSESEYQSSRVRLSDCHSQTVIFRISVFQSQTVRLQDCYGEGRGVCEFWSLELFALLWIISGIGNNRGNRVITNMRVIRDIVAIRFSDLLGLLGSLRM
jgi:hypothetical protein